MVNGHPIPTYITVRRGICTVRAAFNGRLGASYGRRTGSLIPIRCLGLPALSNGSNTVTEGGEDDSDSIRALSVSRLCRLVECLLGRQELLFRANRSYETSHSIGPGTESHLHALFLGD